MTFDEAFDLVGSMIDDADRTADALDSPGGDTASAAHRRRANALSIVWLGRDRHARPNLTERIRYGGPPTKFRRVMRALLDLALAIADVKPREAWYPGAMRSSPPGQHVHDDAESTVRRDGPPPVMR